MQPSHQAASSRQQQAPASYANSHQPMASSFSTGYSVPSQPVQPHPLQTSVMLQHQAKEQSDAWRGVQHHQQKHSVSAPAPQMAYSAAANPTQQQQQPPQQYGSQYAAHPQGQHNVNPLWTVPAAASQQSLGVRTPSPSASMLSSAQSASRPVIRGFTHNQLNVLRNQILAFRRIKVSPGMRRSVTRTSRADGRQNVVILGL